MMNSKGLNISEVKYLTFSVHSRSVLKMHHLLQSMLLSCSKTTIRSMILENAGTGRI